MRFIIAVLIISASSGMGQTQKDEFRSGRKPLSYWITQANAPSSAESLDTIVNALARAVGSEDDAQVVAASDALAVLGPKAKAAIPALIARQNHEQPFVRSSAAGALAAMGKTAVPALIELFQQQVGGPSVRAAFILGAIGAEARAAAPVIAAVMQNASPAMQVRYAGILHQIDPALYPGNQSRGLPEAGRVRLDAPDSAEAGWAPATADWPQFHGPHRDSVCRERGLLPEWPEGGPPLLWTLKGLGKGFSTISIDKGMLFTMGDRPVDGDQEAQFVLAFDLQTRHELWAANIGAPFRTGPRCTPTVHGDLVYALGTEGRLLCLERATGKTRWQRDLPQDFGGKMMSGWKFSESPLVDGDRLICTPGGPDAAMVALHRLTGEVLWKCRLPPMGKQGADGAAYASAVVATMHGVRQYVQMLGRGVVGIEAATGRFLWGYNRIACNVANITTPVVWGHYVFVTTAYNTGSALLEIAKDGDTFRANELYFIGPREFQNHHGGVVLVNGHIYGGHRPNGGDPTCINLATGQIAWSEKAPARGSGSVLYADGNLIFRYDRGDVFLVEASPLACKVKGHFTAVKGKGPAWAQPVVHRGRLYLRHGDLLACYDLRAP